MIFARGMVAALLLSGSAATMSAQHSARRSVRHTVPRSEPVAAVDKVHPLVGTQNEGQTYPAAGVPFAMTQWTPQTRAGEIKCVAPYYFTDTKVQGFRGSHFLSGGCVPDYGSFTLMASAGPLKTDAVTRASAFERSSEHASPYAYSVDLKDAGVLAEMTGLSRAGVMRFTFEQAGGGWMVIENNARGGDGWVRVDQQRQEVSGEVPVRREYAGSGKLAGFSGYFVVEFSKPFQASGTWVGSQPKENGTEQRGDGLPLGVVAVAKVTNSVGGSSAAAAMLPTASTRPGFGTYVRFADLHKGEMVLARMGTSFVSVEEARKNLRAEIPQWDFDTVKAQAKAEWTKALGAIAVKDEIPASSVFYTALYHALLHPRTYSDVSGSYPRFAGNGQVEHTDGSIYYDDFSMWDTFRAQHPMLTIIDPRRDEVMMRSLILKGEQGGFLPIFPAWNSYTSEMVGDHVAATLTDAYRKGLRGFDAAKAYELMRKNAMQIPENVLEYRDGKGRRGLASYLKYGYIPLEDHVDDAFHNNEQVSRTLEYAYDDAMIGEMASALGKTEDAELFRQRGQNWRKVVNPEDGFAHGRHADGTWLTPFDPAGKYKWITEGLPWQYTFFVPQDVDGLMALEGGKAGFVKKLDGLFAGKYYDHSNEPSHHIAYLFDAGDAASKTQAHVRALMESEYRDAPEGLAGNDDAGQMSAWYVLSALGIYQVCPGVPEYWLGSPRFDDTTVRLPNGKTLQILAKGAGAGSVYVKRVVFNGKTVRGYKLQYSEIMRGGILRFAMSDKPSDPAGTSAP
jgi:predicted alpha-1,2-mannosidase